MPEQTIICGNALEVLKTFPDESFDCIVTDPAYKLGTSSVKVNADGTINDNKRKRWIKKNADEDNQALIKTGQMIQNIPKFEDWLPEVYRVLKNGCHAYIMINGRNFAELQTKAEKVGFKFQNDLTWLKQNATPNKFYMKSTERILMLRKGKERYINDMGASDVFYVKNPVGKKLHITEKPAELFRQMIIQSTEIGDRVLDPFGGAGALVVACEQCSRQGVMIELLEKNCDIARARLEETEADYLQGGLLCQNAD